MDYTQLDNVCGADPAGDGRYAPPRVTEMVSAPITGKPDPVRIYISHVERQDLTIRMMYRRLTQRINAFNKKLASLKTAPALRFAYHNFCRIHQALRVTPAIAARVTNRVWNLEGLL